MSTQCVLFDSRTVEDLVDGLWEDMDESERPKDPWDPKVSKKLFNEAWKDIMEDFEDLKDTLVKGVLPDDKILLVDRSIVKPKTDYECFSGYLDISSYRLCKPADVFGKWEHLRVYYEDDNIWIMKLARDGMSIRADYQALLVSDKNWVHGSLKDSERREFLESAAMLALGGKGDLRYCIDMYTDSLAPVFRKMLSWNGVCYCTEVAS